MTEYSCTGYPKFHRKFGGETYELIDYKSTKKDAQRLQKDYKLWYDSVRMVSTKDGQCRKCWALYINEAERRRKQRREDEMLKRSGRSTILSTLRWYIRMVRCWEEVGDKNKKWQKKISVFEAHKIVQGWLRENKSDDKVKARTVDFTDLMRDDVIVVEVVNWKPRHDRGKNFAELKNLAKRNGFIVTT